MMKRQRTIIVWFGLALFMVILTVAASIERKSVIGQSATPSPDGNWSLQLKLVEYSTLWHRRKVLDADLIHKSNRDLDVRTSIPMQQADAVTISNQHPDHPIVWTADSSKVSYWIDTQLKDTIQIEADDEKHVFQRDLYGLHAVWYENKNSDDL